ncbi:AfsR/SARP family transcriptional regulator [Streptacidiphilus sp. PAMC 29251]
MSVTENGRDRTPSAPKHRQMLALLLMNANHVVSMAQLTEELWEYNAPPRAVAAVHTYVMQLRRILHDGPPPVAAGRLTTCERGYLLEVREHELDLHAYERQVRSGLLALDRGELRAGAGQIRAAHAMWNGQGLIDAPTGPLLCAALATLEHDYRYALVQRVDAELRLGRHHRLLAELCALVHQDPINEELTGRLMLALYRSGRQADALVAFHRLRRTLREELGESPNHSLHRLITDMLAGHPRLEPPATSEPQSLDVVSRRPRPAPGQPRTSSTGDSGWSEARPLLLGA